MEGPTRSPQLPLDAGRLERFESFVAAFRSVFHRADQSLRFRAYLRGLLEPTGRKNVESIAAAAGAVMMVESDLAQALQHFVSQSPWDARRLFTAVRAHSAAIRVDSGAVWVVHDGVFAKKGRHSVGVQRQFARALGKKINCQIGVFVSQLGPRGFFPLAARLYLPAQWIRDNPEACERTVPEANRTAASKSEVALALLDEVRGEGEAALPVVAEAGYLSVPEFADGLASRGLATPPDAVPTVARAVAHFEWLSRELGIDHFEGRTWHGWHHHVGLVVAAYHFVAGEAISPDFPPFATSPR